MPAEPDPTYIYTSFTTAHISKLMHMLVSDYVCILSNVDVASMCIAQPDPTYIYTSFTTAHISKLMHMPVSDYVCTSSNVDVASMCIAQYRNASNALHVPAHSKQTCLQC